MRVLFRPSFFCLRFKRFNLCANAANKKGRIFLKTSEIGGILPT